MVIAERFVWAHLPKAAGDATLRMFECVPGLIRFADPATSPDKHLPFFAREAELEGKLLVMNLRRLPDWAISGAQHKAAYGLDPDYVPLPLEDPDTICRRTDADDLLRWMTDHDRLSVDRWLRAETITEDLIAFLDELGMLNRRRRAAIRRVGRVNAGTYDRTAAMAAFAPEQIAELYRRNPTWSAIERELYGPPPDPGRSVSGS